MSAKPVPAETEIITDASRLKQVVDELLEAPRLSLDIESDGFYNYAERVCIVTLSSENLNVVVDTLAIDDAAQALGRITARAERPLLMHSGQNDVLALKRDYDLEFGSVQDTSVAAMLLDLPQTGLAALVEGYLGTHLEKELQRYDWSRRPIELHHVSYLVNDTQHLFRLHDLMIDELRKLDLLDEYEIECRAVAEAEPRERVFDPDRFRRIKGHGDLSEQQRGALKALYAWRNDLARSLDRAPFRIISDNTLLDIARTLPTTPDAIGAMRGVGEWLMAEQAGAMLEAIQSGLSSPANMKPPRRNDTPAPRMDPRQRDTLGRLKRWREAQKQTRGVGLQAILPSAVLKDLVLAPPKDIEQLAANPRVGSARAKRYGADLIKLLNGRREG
ncbi:MAG: HRDC domain-containing protein [Planctomycetes bacterium]|nr:HRDC domain-containing protein [Planctomycetota bacterium]